jgi:antitoxin VapB
VSLNIKNEEVHDLVRRLAALTGQSQTSAVEDAVRRRLAELQHEDDREVRVQRLLEIGRQTAALMTPEQKESLNGDWLYDDLGLPR